VFLFRRLIFSIFVVVLEEYPAFQLISTIFFNLLFIIYLGLVNPYFFSKSNKVEMVNEVIHMFISYHYLLFTDFVPDEEMRFNLGWSSIFFCCLLIVFNIGLLIQDMVKAIFSKCKRQCEKMKKKQDSEDMK
jgi:hypothetical protein